MAVSIKYKITLGTLFLFALLVLSGGLSIFYLIQLKSDAKNILKDNYESLEYCHRMQAQLDSLHQGFHGSLIPFGFYLSKEEHNLTEPGERENTVEVRRLFTALSAGDTSHILFAGIQERIQNILSLNMLAIKKKNELAEMSAEKAYTIISAIAVIIFLIGFTFSFNFPAIVTIPVRKLMEAIKEISAKNYRHRIHLDTKDEFGQLADAFNTMSERLEEFENSNLNKLIFEKTRAEAVINSLKDASIGIDNNQVILFANERALQLLGLRAENIIGKEASVIARQNDLFDFLNNSESNNPFKIVSDGKEHFYIKETMEVKQGETYSKVLILKNITSFKELDVAKTNFISTVSHELKTPLASSDFSLKLLEDSRVGTLTDEQKELVQQLKNDNMRMLRILSELLNMTQVETGKIQLDIQPVYPRTVVENSIKAIDTAAKEKKITIHQNIIPGLPAIPADLDKISWVLNNLLTNAIKLSSASDSITVSVEQVDDIVRFSVSDKGPGIETVYLTRIFERYFQVPGKKDKTGSGIGLSICKELIEAMHGRIWVKSKPGEGSTFGFDIPLR